ncbi:hypothetical protein F53441_13111 [Fusarium austroafricanum]|uniref:Uncharacterized protein n=1 Tax=Fusarium austroafricanum TaxID=2364996 RepID=A0A8H4JUM4_9HYPO|nr:hypothetical protein F53441_13111 [Fusarium austroafricanum]
MPAQYEVLPSNAAAQHSLFRQNIHQQQIPMAPLGQGPAQISPSSPSKARSQGLLARRRSRLKLWLGLFAKWFITVIFVLVVYIILIRYTNHDVIDKKQKKYFNALITGFLIALGLSTMSQLTSAVSDLRWWILSRRPRSRQKVKAILHVQSMTQVLILAFKSSRWTIHLSVAAWVVLFLSSQVGYASIGLCYSVDKSEDKALMVSGNVSIANLTTIETSRISNSSNIADGEEYAANSYGIISLGYNQGTLDDIPVAGTLFFGDDKVLFCDTFCSYVFHETNTATTKNPDTAPITVITDRRVNATTQCSAYRVSEGGNGTSNSITVEIGSRKTKVTVPSKNGPDRKTYMSSNSETCGDDCSSISVFEPSSTDPWFYNCTTRLSAVANATHPEHKLGKNLTHLATSAIALGGYDTTGGLHYTTYPVPSTFGVPLNGSAEVLELLLSRFTIGVIAAVIQSNDDIVLSGQAPTMGEKLNVSHWNALSLVLWITVILQLLLAVLATLISERVVVPEGDPLAEAQVLRHMINDDNIDSAIKSQNSCARSSCPITPTQKSFLIDAEMLMLGMKASKTCLEVFSWPMWVLMMKDYYNGEFEKYGKQVSKEHYERLQRRLADGKRPFLEWSVEDGWGPLCEFLGKPVPDVPFPDGNKGSGQFQENMEEATEDIVMNALRNIVTNRK